MEFVKVLSQLVLPLLLLVFLLAAFKNKVNAYDEFVAGTRESLQVIFNIFPPVLGLMVAIGMLRSSGLLDFLTTALSPVLSFLRMPQEVLPIALLRPLSGSGGLAVLTDIIKEFGADSLAGFTASVIAGSTETTFYTIAVYFGSVAVQNPRHTVKSALVGDVVGILASIFVCRFFFLLGGMGV